MDTIRHQTEEPLDYLLFARSAICKESLKLAVE